MSDETKLICFGDASKTSPEAREKQVEIFAEVKMVFQEVEATYTKRKERFFKTADHSSTHLQKDENRVTRTGRAIAWMEKFIQERSDPAFTGLRTEEEIRGYSSIQFLDYVLAQELTVLKECVLRLRAKEALAYAGDFAEFHLFERIMEECDNINMELELLMKHPCFGG